MRINLAMILVAMTACGEAQDPHEVIECEIDWTSESSNERCERACTAGSMESSSATCGTCRIAEFDGVEGCCTIEGSIGSPDIVVVRWTECH